MIEIKNLNAWLLKTRAAKDKIKSKATDHVQSQVLKVFKTILKESPQYSGDFVSNWNVVTNAYSSPGYQELPYKDFLEGEYERTAENTYKIDYYKSLLRSFGHPAAMRVAMLHASDVISSIKWNTKVYIVNTAPIADAVATGSLYPYRPVHAHLEGQSFISYIKQKHGMGWIG